MGEVRDIVRISLPFASGVLFACLCPALPATLCLILACAFLCSLWLSTKVEWLFAALLFFFLGAFCYGTAALTGGSSFETKGLALRALHKFSALIDRTPFENERTRALLRALLTGQKDLLPKGVIADFRDAGAAHILALSGLHLGIIYLIISKMLFFLGNSRIASALRSFLVVVLSGFYALMTGAAPSIVRAFLFICISEIGRHCPGRSRSPIGTWCLALLLQLCFNPLVISSLGFQLSYLAMLGIFTIFPWLEGFYPKSTGLLGHDPLRRIWSAVALTCSCQLFTAPLVWWRFKTFPKYFIITNLLALPLTEALMICGIASILLYALGICPSILLRVTDFLAQTLLNTLSIIADM